MGTSAMQDDPMLRLRYFQETGQSGEATKYEQYLRETGQFSGGSSIHDEYKSGRLAKRMQRENANDTDLANAETPSYGEQALGGLASLARDIPGAEVVQAGVRSLVRGQSYPAALNDIRGAEEDAPAASRNINKVIGGGLAVAAIPGGPVLQGARYGILGGLLAADPANVKDRLHNAATQGAIGAAVGKAGELIGTGVRALGATSLGKSALGRKGVMEAADKIAYGKAEAEAAATGGTSPAIRRALNASDIAPYAETIRQSRTFHGADDATVLREAYKLMSERQGLLGTRIVNANDFKAGTSLEARDVTLAKQSLLNATEKPWVRRIPAEMAPAPETVTAQSPAPSLREALARHQEALAEAARRAEGTPLQQNRNPFSSQRVELTPAMRATRDALERHGAEQVVSPSLTGAPPGPRMVEMAPAQKIPQPAVMPSYRAAVEQHAKMASERDAFRQGADAARRILNGAEVAGKKLETNSPEAFMAAIKKMTPEQARAASEGLLGRLKQKTTLSPNPLSLFGTAKDVAGFSKLAPYLRALDEQAKRQAPQMIQNALTAGGTSLFD